MCGRYVIYTDEEEEEMMRIIDIVNKNTMANISSKEVFPSDKAPVIYKKDSVKGVSLFKWGFPSNQRSKLIINARNETVAEKSMFRDSFFSRRCVVPASGFFEWNKQKEKLLIRSGESKTIYMAGIYKEIEGTGCFVIITVPAGKYMRDIHDRMPLLIQRSNVGSWLDDHTLAGQYALAASETVLNISGA